MRQADRPVTARAEDGYTLIELLVAMMVTAIVLAVVVSLFTAVARTTTDSDSTRLATGTAANALNEISRVIRSAATTATGPDASGNQTLPTSAVVLATPTSLTLTSNIGGTAASPAPVQAAFTVDGQGQLMEVLTPATSTNGFWTYGTTGTTRTVATSLVTTGAPLFTYFDSTGAVITPPVTGLTTSQCAQVASITVTVTVANPQIRGGSSTVVLTSQVGMPNLALTGGGS